MLTYSYPWKQFSFRCMYCAGLWILQHCNLLLFGSKKVNFTNKTISCRIWIKSFKLNEFNEIMVSTYSYSIIGGLHLPRYFSLFSVTLWCTTDQGEIYCHTRGPPLCNHQHSVLQYTELDSTKNKKYTLKSNFSQIYFFNLKCKWWRCKNEKYFRFWWRYC